MSNQTSVTKTASTKHNLRSKVLLEKLRAKLKNFTILDQQGIIVGKIKDVSINSERQLNLVVSEADAPSNSRLFLLRSSYIQQVDYYRRALLVDLSKVKVHQLPEFKMPEHPGIELSTLPPPPDMETPEVIDHNVIQGENDAGADSLTTVAPSAQTQDESENDDSQILEAVVEEEVIRLLEERLVVDMTKRKVGEVIVRKEVETRMVQVPVRYEKLIVEQISPQYKQLAEIELGHEEIPGIESTEVTSQKTEVDLKEGELTIKGEFRSPKAASLLLEAIAMQRHPGCKKVRVEIVLEDAQHQETYQKWFERCSGK